MTHLEGLAPARIAATEGWKRMAVPIVLLTSLSVAGCTWFQSDARRGYAQDGEANGRRHDGHRYGRGLGGRQ
jgi:hypothetical protein